MRISTPMAVALAVAAAAVPISGCGAGTQNPAAADGTTGGPITAAGGGALITYRAEGSVSSGQLGQVADVLRARLKADALTGEVSSVGDTVTVAVAGIGSLRQAGALADRLAGRGRLVFIDWEPNVLGPGCKPDPTNSQVTGGPVAGSPVYGLHRYDAVRRAASCPAAPSRASSWYVLDDARKRVVAGPARNRLALPARKAGQVTVRVAGNVLLVGAEAPQADGGSERPDRWYVLADKPALDGGDLVDPVQSFDSGRGGSHQPVVAFDFTAPGAKAWREITRAIAARGQHNAIPGADPLSSAQHFAIVLDDRLISVPYIDFRTNPDGVDASNGSQIQGGFTVQSARALASVLRSGLLPVDLKVAEIELTP